MTFYSSPLQREKTKKTGTNLTHHNRGRKYTEVTTLSSRTFGTWTFLAAIVRVYAAYNIATPALYDLCLWSYVIAFAHFFSEWLFFKTARLGEGLLGPVLVSTLSILWMALQREAYLAAGNA